MAAAISGCGRQIVDGPGIMRVAHLTWIIQECRSEAVETESRRGSSGSKKGTGTDSKRNGASPRFSARRSRAISRILCPIVPRGTIGGSHFSGTRIAPGLKRPTRGPRPGRPLRSSTGVPLLTPSYLALLQVTLAGQPCRHDRGGLLPRHFTLA